MQLEKAVLGRTLLKIKETAPERVIIFWCGQIGTVWYNWLSKNEVKICAFVVSDNEEISMESINQFQVSIYHLCELPRKYKECLFIPAVYNEKLFDEMVEILQNNGYKKMLFK